MVGRREQVFDACNHLYSKGFREKHQFTYRAMHDACETLGYPRGHQATMVKYRDEWLNTNLSEVKSQETSNTEPESHTLQSTLDALLKEHKLKVEAELKAEYDAKQQSLELEIESLRTKLDTTENVLASTEKENTHLQEKHHSVNTFSKALHERNIELSDEKAALTGKLEAVTTQLNQANNKVNEQNQASKLLLDAKTETIEKLEEQLVAQKEINAQLTAQQKEMKLSYKDVVKNNNKLETKLNELTDDYKSIKTDFARQEQTINLLERERGEFYKEFTVKMKKLEHISKIPKILKEQAKIVKKLNIDDD